MEEWNSIHERLSKVPYQRKIQIKKVLHHLELPETIMLSPPTRKVPTKEAKKRVRSKANEASTS